MLQIKDFNIMNISAEIEDGIFRYIKKKNIEEKEIENIEIEEVISKFRIYEENIKDAIDYDTIINVLPNCKAQHLR